MLNGRLWVFWNGLGARFSLEGGRKGGNHLLANIYKSIINELVNDILCRFESKTLSGASGRASRGPILESWNGQKWPFELREGRRTLRSRKPGRPIPTALGASWMEKTRPTQLTLDPEAALQFSSGTTKQSVSRTS